MTIRHVYTHMWDIVTDMGAMLWQAGVERIYTGYKVPPPPPVSRHVYVCIVE